MKAKKKKATSEMKRSKPWIEPGLYVECPYCYHCHLLESDMSVYLPELDFNYDCKNCGKVFVVEGEKDS